MLNLSFCYLVSILNLIYAAIIYLSLHGWLVAHEPSGMQLLVHLIITAPCTIITTIWYFYLYKRAIAPKTMCLLNGSGILIPIMSMQTGVTYYHYDKIGLVIAIIISIALSGIFSNLVYRQVSS